MKPRLVFLHGAFCGGWAFDAFRRPFEAAGYVCHAPNLPCHQQGADRAALARLGLRDYAAAVGAATAALDSPAVLIGHSMGGLIAQIVASRQAIAGLVLLAPSAPWGVAPTTADEVAAGAALYALGDFWNRAIEPRYPPARAYSLDRLEPAQRRDAFARFVPESGRAAFETLNWGLDPTMAAAAPAPAITAPVLALVGGQDRLNPPGTVRAIAARFARAQAETETFAAMSHWLVGEPGWADVADRTLDWLSRRGFG